MLTGPLDLRGFVGFLKVRAGRVETPDQVVMQVIWLRFTGGNAMYIDSHEERLVRGANLNARFLKSFAGCGRIERSVGFFDVAAGQQPSFQTMVVHDEHAFAIGMEDERRASDVTRAELLRRKGLRCVKEE